MKNIISEIDNANQKGDEPHTCGIEAARVKFQAIADELGLNKTVKVELNPSRATAHTSFGSDEIYVKIKLSIVSDELIKSTLLHEYAHIINDCEDSKCKAPNELKYAKSQQHGHCKHWEGLYIDLLEKRSIDYKKNDNGEPNAEALHFDTHNYSEELSELFDDWTNARSVTYKNIGGGKWTGENAIAGRLAGCEVGTLNQFNKAGHNIVKGSTAYKMSAAFNNYVNPDAEDGAKWVSPEKLDTLPEDEQGDYKAVARPSNFYVFCKCQTTPKMDVSDDKAQLKKLRTNKPRKTVKAA